MIDDDRLLSLSKLMNVCQPFENIFTDPETLVLPPRITILHTSLHKQSGLHTCSPVSPLGQKFLDAPCSLFYTFVALSSFSFTATRALTKPQAKQSYRRIIDSVTISCSLSCHVFMNIIGQIVTSTVRHTLFIQII